MTVEVTAWAGVGIGAGSFLVAVMAIVMNSRSQGRVSSLQERIVQIEEQRDERQLSATRQAVLRAELRRPRANSTRLYIVNSGEAEARNIRVEMDGQPLEQHSASVSNDEIPQYVGPNSEISCLLAVTLGVSPPFDVKITWDDDYAEGRTYSNPISW